MTEEAEICQSATGACLLDEDFAQARLPKRVVLQVELVKPVEDCLVSVHVQHVHVEVISGQVERLEDLQQCQKFAITEDDNFARLLLELALDETQQVLLVHARGVMHVCVHLQS